MSDPFDTNAEDVSDWFEDQRDILEDDVEEMLDRATEKTYEAALQKVPVDTGKLRDSLIKGDKEVYSMLDYAPHVGLGTVFMSGTDYLWGPAETEIKNALRTLANG